MKKPVILILALLVISFGQENGAKYLIITYDSFYDIVLPLAEWKYKKGMKSKVVKYSEVGSSQYGIRNYIIDAYNNWDIQPEYLLLVGAPNLIPFPQVSGTYSDNYYTNIEGDIYNEILSGRLTVHNTTEAQTVINKILAYERNPNRADTLWFKKACLIVNIDYDPPDDSIYWSDLHYAAGLMSMHRFVKIDTMCDTLGHTGYSVINAVNEGRSIVMYRGVGVNNWSSPFNINPDQAQNGTKLPVVLSITCRTIGTSSTPAGAERWLLTGSPMNLRGAAGYFATTTVVINQAYLRSAVAKGFHGALFGPLNNNTSVTFGKACEVGRKKVYEMYPYQGGAHEYYGFTTLGDPEMSLWTGAPCSLFVDHPDFITIGNTHLEVTVKDAEYATPINNALVCIAGKTDTNIYTLDTTDLNGIATFDIAPQIIDDTIFVTVTGRNLQPYEGFMIVKPASCYILYLNAIIDDSLAGNDDGYINPTEEINFPLWIENIGESTGVNIIGALRTVDDYITITDSIKNFGDIPDHDSAFTGEDGYNFSVAATCTNMHHIDFELTCTDINDSVWVSCFEETVYAPKLILHGTSISGGNGNNILEPGETVDVIVTLKNGGDAAADSVSALLRSDFSDVFILDSIGTFGYIGIDSLKDNTLDPFVINVDSTLPIGTIINFKMVVFTNYNTDTFDFNLVVGQRNYFIWNPDPTPEPGRNIDSILVSLGYNGNCDTTLAPYLGMYQVLFVCLGVYSSRYFIPQGSAEALAITDYLNNGGRVYLEGSSVWFVDPEHYGGHDFGPLFGIDGVAWSHGNMGPISGQAGTFTAGMYFNYAGENKYMDHIDPIGSGFLIFRDVNDNYNCGVANDAGTYRTVGTSFELGLLADSTSPSTRAELLDKIMHFFGIIPGVDEKTVHTESSSYRFNVYPIPAYDKIMINYNIGLSTKSVSFKIYDAAGRLVKTFSKLTPDASGPNSITWYGDDNFGRRVSQGIYFVQFTIDNFKKTHKIILLKE
jgi:hypothetical protein